MDEFTNMTNIYSYIYDLLSAHDRRTILESLKEKCPTINIVVSEYIRFDDIVSHFGITAQQAIDSCLAECKSQYSNTIGENLLLDVYNDHRKNKYYRSTDFDPINAIQFLIDLNVSYDVKGKDGKTVKDMVDAHGNGSLDVRMLIDRKICLNCVKKRRDERIQRVKEVLMVIIMPIELNKLIIEYL
jgi:hypothetical protein